MLTDAAAAEDAVLKLSRLYRYILNASVDQVVTLEEELAIVRTCVALEQHRYGERLRVNFDVKGTLDGVKVPALLLQPIVENAIRHGVGKKIGAGTVGVSVDVSPSECRISIRDNGNGWSAHTPQSAQSKSGGFGFRSVRERLRLLYGQGYQFEIEDNEGVVVAMTIPLGVATEPARTASGLRLESKLWWPSSSASRMRCSGPVAGSEPLWRPLRRRRRGQL